MDFFDQLGDLVDSEVAKRGIVDGIVLVSDHVYKSDDLSVLGNLLRESLRIDPLQTRHGFADDFELPNCSSRLALKDSNATPSVKAWISSHASATSATGATGLATGLAAAPGAGDEGVSLEKRLSLK